MRRLGLAELGKEPQVVIEEQTQIVDAIAQHGQALGAHAESEALELFRVDAGHAQHAWVHHAAAHHFQPAGLLAHAAAVAGTHHALDVDFGGRFGEGEERWAETHRQFFLEEYAQEFFDGALEVGEVDIAIDQQAFDLVEHRRVGDIRVAAVYAAGAHNADGSFTLVL